MYIENGVMAGYDFNLNFTAGSADKIVACDCLVGSRVRIIIIEFGFA